MYSICLFDLFVMRGFVKLAMIWIVEQKNRNFILILSLYIYARNEVKVDLKPKIKFLYKKL